MWPEGCREGDDAGRGQPQCREQVAVQGRGLYRNATDLEQPILISSLSCFVCTVAVEAVGTVTTPPGGGRSAASGSSSKEAVGSGPALFFLGEEDGPGGAASACGSRPRACSTACAIRSAFLQNVRHNS